MNTLRQTMLSCFLAVLACPQSYAADPKLYTVAGGGSIGDGGPAAQASLGFPTGLAFDPSGRVLYIGDETNHSVRRVDLSPGSTKHITTLVNTASLAGLVDNVPAAAGKLNLTMGITIDADRNMYIADRVNSRIRKVNGPNQPNPGVLTTVAGTGISGYNGDNRLATTASVSRPVEVRIYEQGGKRYLLIVDQYNHLIRQVDLSTGLISTVAGLVVNGKGQPGYNGDGIPATSAKLNHPAAVVRDVSGNLYIADKTNHCIRRVFAPDGGLPHSGTIETFAGRCGQPGAAATDANGNPLSATAARFRQPVNLAFDGNGDLFVMDESNNLIRKILMTPARTIVTVAGTQRSGFSPDGTKAINARLNLPTGHGSPGMTFDGAGNLVFSDRGNQRIRRIEPVEGRLVTLVGGGPIGNNVAAKAVHIVVPGGVGVDSTGNLYVVDRGHHVIRKVDAATKQTTIVAGTGVPGYKIDGQLSEGIPATSALLNLPMGVLVDDRANIYINDQFNQRIRKVNGPNEPNPGQINTIAGTGQKGFNETGAPLRAVDAHLAFVKDMCLDSAGNLYLADQNNHRLRKVDGNGFITTVAGTGIPGYNGDSTVGQPLSATAARLNRPNSCVVDDNGNIYISDNGNHRLRKIDAATKTITTVAGIGSAGYNGDSDTVAGRRATTAKLSYPSGIALMDDDTLYLADFSNGIVRRVDLQNDTITTIAGQPDNSGFAGDDGLAKAGQLNLPLALAVDAAGNIFIGDVPNSRVRAVCVDPTYGVCKGQDVLAP